MRKPAVVRSYDQATRTCRVEIPGITDKADVLPVAQIEYAVGDDSRKTEVEILPGDLVWVDFIDDDPRYPIITGYRNPRTGNSADLRKSHHKNIEFDADTTLTLKVGSSTIEITGSGIKLTADRIDLN